MSLFNNIRKQKGYLNVIRSETEKIYTFTVDVYNFVTSEYASAWGSNADRDYIISSILVEIEIIEFNVKKLDVFVKKANDYIKQMEEFQKYTPKSYASTLSIKNYAGSFSYSKKSEISIDTQKVKSISENLKQRSRWIKESTAIISKKIKSLDSEIRGLYGGKNRLLSYTKAIDNASFTNVSVVIDSMINNYETAEKQMKYIIELIETGKYDVSKYSGLQGLDNLKKKYNNSQKKTIADRITSGVQNYVINPITNTYKNNVGYRIAWDLVGDVFTVTLDGASIYADIFLPPPDVVGAISDCYGLLNDLTAIGCDNAALFECMKGNKERAEKYRTIDSMTDFAEYAGDEEAAAVLSTLDDIDTGYSIYKGVKGIKKGIKSIEECTNIRDGIKEALGTLTKYDNSEIKISVDAAKKYNMSLLDVDALIDYKKNMQAAKNYLTGYGVVKDLVSGSSVASTVYKNTSGGNIYKKFESIIDDLSKNNQESSMPNWMKKTDEFSFNNGPSLNPL